MDDFFGFQLHRNMLIEKQIECSEINEKSESSPYNDLSNLVTLLIKIATLLSTHIKVRLEPTRKNVAV